MGSSWPLHNAQPLGAKTKLMILISERNGSAIVFYSHRVSRNYFHEAGRQAVRGKKPRNSERSKPECWLKSEAARILCASFKDCKHIFCRQHEIRRLSRLRRMSQ